MIHGLLCTFCKNGTYFLHLDCWRGSTLKSWSKQENDIQKRYLFFQMIILDDFWSNAPRLARARYSNNLCFLSISVNIFILVFAVVIFLLVLHHNILGLSDLLKRELSGMVGHKFSCDVYNNSKQKLFPIRNIFCAGPFVCVFVLIVHSFFTSRFW